MTSENKILDVVGVGFGPSNLALAIVIEEWQQAQGRQLNTRFIEKQPRFSWHSGMLLPGSTMQISFLKDLVSLRNPLSRYTFINYLHERGRLSSFINLQTFFPSRIEFNDYLAWAAERVGVPVSYGQEVVSIEPHADGLVKVTARDAEGWQHYLSRSVVVAAGGRGIVPDVFSGLSADSKIFHSSQYLKVVDALPAEGRFAIVGAGQSAAEIFLDLGQRFPVAGVDLFSRGQALRVSDDSPFVNEIFEPSFVDDLYAWDEDTRKMFLEAFSSTNYSVIDRDVVERIYNSLYQQRVTGESRQTIHFATHIESVRSVEGRIILRTSQRSGSGERHANHSYDAVFLATGYDRSTYLPMLETFQRPSSDVSRYYRLSLPAHPTCNIYIQGGCESSHGLSDTLLSILPIRSEEILNDILHHVVMCDLDSI